MKKIIKGMLLVLIGIPLILATLIWLDGGGQLEKGGEIIGGELPGEWIEERTLRQQAVQQALEAPVDKQILFGDLHVHSTFSMDAFLWSLPMMNGEGVHPPADACDYARYCSDLDFWSLTDHAEAMTPRHWQMIKDTVRDCNARTDPDNPDLVTYLGWEWTQVGQTPEDHYGHRNVVLLEQDEDKVPARPITSGGLPLKHMRQRTMSLVEETLAPYVADFDNRQRLKDQFAKQAELRATTLCPDGVHVKDLPADCVESAETPEALWTKLDQWGGEVLAIPHGTTWGFYTPPGVKWDKQLTATQHNDRYQKLIEVHSGHGNSEEYRDWRAVEFNEDGSKSCPAPSAGYLPCCHRAGELIQARCDDPASAECQAAVEKAKLDYLDASVAGHLVVPGAKPEDWLNCGQCEDCYLPALNYRPGNSVQYIMALSNFDQPGEPSRFRFGFIASSDNHASQPGTGYKEIGRHKGTEVFGPTDDSTRARFSDAAKRSGTAAESIPFDRRNTKYNLFQYSESERLGSFFYTGGLVAVHSPGRDRKSVWDAMQRKEVYGTSGDRILLWFDLLNAVGGELPMGSEVQMKQTPRFRVRAAGAFEQQPGCPQHSVEALGAERLEYMCGSECYNPGDNRKPIERIEVVRIRPQAFPGEPVKELIEDPWLTLPCDDQGAGCTVEFEDPDFTISGRDTLYYVRALQAPTPTINGDQLRCTRDESGQCVQVDPCYGDNRTDAQDDCLAPAAERAWSSPIFVDYVSTDAMAVVAVTEGDGE